MIDSEKIAKLKAELDQHSQLIGDVTIAWNSNQSIVFAIFGLATGLKFETAQAIFFALRTDFAQRDITIAALDAEMMLHQKLCSKIKKPIHKLNSLSNERNATIHTMWSLENPDSGIRPNPGAIHNPSLDLNDPIGQMERLLSKLDSNLAALQTAFNLLAQHVASRGTPA